MYSIKPCYKTDSTITLPKIISLIHQPENNAIVSFGVKTFDVKVEFSDLVEENELHLSEHLIKELKLPLSCSYEILTKENKIIIGPFIGILTDLTDHKVLQMLSTYKSFVKGYPRIGGAIVIFSLEGIHIEDQTISGFLFQPENDAWTFGTFPFPGAVMSILEASLTSKWNDFHRKMNHFQSVLGPKVFNYPHFSKWEMHKLLLPSLGSFLPETTLYQEPSDISYMLQYYDSLYIKPLNGRLGKSIYKIEKTGSKIAVHFYKKQGKQVKYFENFQEMTSFFTSQLVPDMFLIQQTLPLMVSGDRIIDFRVMMVKNEWGQWENLGIYSRYGAKGHFVSNITAGGYTEMADDTLRKVWSFSSEEIEKVKASMDQLVKDSLALFEQSGYHLANIGFDVGMDKNGSIYLIEINHQNPDPYIALKANNRKAFYLARFKNMLYAKHLEGYE